MVQCRHDDVTYYVRRNFRLAYRVVPPSHLGEWFRASWLVIQWTGTGTRELPGAGTVYVTFYVHSDDVTVTVCVTFGVHTDDVTQYTSRLASIMMKLNSIRHVWRAL